MITLSGLICILAAGAVQVSVAPDQPVPHVYVDDPLIVEFRSDEDATILAEVQIEPDFGSSPVLVSLGEIRLRARGTQWRPVEGIPMERGRYRVTVRTTQDGAVSESQALLCRIDRPNTDAMLALSVGFDGPASAALVALRNICIHGVRLDTRLDGFAPMASDAAAKGFRVALAVDAAHVSACESLVKDLGDRIGRWEVDAAGSAETLRAMVKTIRETGSRAPVVVVVSDMQTYQTLLLTEPALMAGGVAFRGPWPLPGDLLAMRSMAESAGIEGMTIYSDVQGNTEQADLWNSEAGLRLVRTIVSGIPLGVLHTDVAAPLAFDQDFGPGYVYLSALAQRLRGAQWVGRLNADPNTQILVFRDGERWVAVAWTEQPVREVPIPVGEAADVAVFDARNNPGTVSLQNGSALLTLSSSPQFLTGRGGSIVAEAARTMVQIEAVAFARTEPLRTQLPADVLEAVNKFATSPLTYERLDFFTLLKLFPRIEELQHTGALPLSVSGPAMGGLARLARHLCTAEQERGEAFIEPIQNTLANCGQIQSSYLTGSPGSTESRQRPDWLLTEVNRLMAEAERLTRQNLGIEASAVAAMAEWRARALEVAAKPRAAVEPPPPQVPVAGVGSGGQPEDAPSEEKKETVSEKKEGDQNAGTAGDTKAYSSGKAGKKTSRKRR